MKKDQLNLLERQGLGFRYGDDDQALLEADLCIADSGRPLLLTEAKSNLTRPYRSSGFEVFVD